MILGTTSAIVSKGTKGTIFGVQCYRRGITSRLRWWTTTWSEAVSWPRVPNYWHEIVYRQYYRFLLGRIPVITRTGDLFNDQGTRRRRQCGTTMGMKGCTSFINHWSVNDTSQDMDRRISFRYRVDRFIVLIGFFFFFFFFHCSGMLSKNIG